MPLGSGGAAGMAGGSEACGARGAIPDTWRDGGCPGWPAWPTCGAIGDIGDMGVAGRWAGSGGRG
jgi:hypothetical protein